MIRIKVGKKRLFLSGVIKPRSVHLMSHPYNGLMKFYGGYAQFGGDLEKMIVQVLKSFLNKQMRK